MTSSDVNSYMGVVANSEYVVSDAEVISVECNTAENRINAVVR